MKKSYTCFCMIAGLFISLLSTAQVVDVANTGLVNPIGLAKNGNRLFISSVGNMSIQEKDLSNPFNTATTAFIPNLSFAVFLAMQGNDLYIPLLTSNKVAKIDVSNPTAALVDVVTNVNLPIGLAFRNNEMYVSLREDGKIVKVDITQPNPTPVDVITGIPGTFVNGIAFRGDELYITHGDAISKIDVTDPTPTLVEVLPNASATFVAFDGDFLYFSQTTASKVSRINVLDATPTIEEFLSLPNDPWGLLIDGNDLFIAEQTGSRVVRFDLATLSLDEASRRTFTYYPNPTKDYLHINGLPQHTAFALTDQHGKEIMKGSLDSVDQLDMSQLANGIYFLRLANYEVKKIVKY